MKIDMHCHTKAGSIDARVSLAGYAEILSAKGFDGMLVTDHNSYRGYEKWKKQTAERREEDFRVFCGVEYDTGDCGHFIVILPEGMRPAILRIRGMKAECLIKLVHSMGGVLGPAHPYGSPGSSIMKSRAIKKKPWVLSQVDFIETFNTCESMEANRKAAALAKSLGKPAVGGSDAHKEKYIGMGFTWFDRSIRNNDDLIACIKAAGIKECGGRERKPAAGLLRKEAFYSTAGFMTFNLMLGALYLPLRKLYLEGQFML